MIDIDHLIKSSRKQKDSKSVIYYQNVKAEFTKIEKEKGNPLLEDTQIRILAKYIKKLEDSISSFIEANREDLASEYREELEVLKKLLPEPVNESQIYSELVSWGNQKGFFTANTSTKIEEISFQFPKKEMGSAIKHLKSKFPGADGKMISEIVKKYIVCPIL